MPELAVFVIVKVCLILVIFTIVMTLVPVMIWLERKVIADIQNRIGPNRVGPIGLLQPIADAVKLIMKEDIIPARADRFLYFIAPALLLFPPLVVVAVIPFGPTVTVAGRQFQLEIAGSYRYGSFYVPEISVGILFLLAITSLSVYGVVLAGWASANKWGLLGGLRSSAQMISYELPLGLALAGPLLMAGSLRLEDVVNVQVNTLWFILPQFVMFFIYLTSGIAETNRAPFDLPEAEQELIAGYHTEYSSFRFAMFFMGEYVAMIIVSMVVVTFFFGGWHGLYTGSVGWLGPVWFLIKVMAVLYFYIWVRGTWPRVRYDQLMRLGWKLNIPAALLNLLITAAVMAVFPAPVGSRFPSMTAVWVMTGVSLVLGAVLFFAVSAALKGSTEYITRRGQRWTGGTTFEVLSGRQEE